MAPCFLHNIQLAISKKMGNCVTLDGFAQMHFFMSEKSSRNISNW
jgi:hypothetical protein